MHYLRHFTKFISAAIFLALCSLSLNAQDANQLGFTSLQAKANEMVERGQLVEAEKLLRELVNRVEKDEKAEMDLSFPIFLIGTANIQKFVSTANKSNLTEALKWYEKLEKEYPGSEKLKDAILKKIDVLRILGRTDEAVALMKKVLNEDYPFKLSFTESAKNIKDLAQTYYGTGKLKEGLPYFGRLLDTARNPEDQALAAAASFEALIEAKRTDDAMKLIPTLAKESQVRYNPRLNVAFLKTSDFLVENNRLTDAAILLNLIKTTDIMIKYYEARQSQDKKKLKQRKAFKNAADVIQELEQKIKNTESTLTQLRKLPTLRNELLVRRARNYTKTNRIYEAFWMFYDLMEENPKDKQIEFYSYASFSNAMKIGKTETMLQIGIDYMDSFPSGNYYPDIAIGVSTAYRKLGKNVEFESLTRNFLDTRPTDSVSTAMFAEWGGFMMEKGRFEELIEQIEKWKTNHNNPIFADALSYWGGLARLQTGEFKTAITDFETILTEFKGSVYKEDSMLRNGAALFYDQQFLKAREILLSYTKKYPSGDALDQAYYFLGEIEFLVGNYELALNHFKRADELTTLQDVHDGVAFRIGSLYETSQKYEDMSSHFIAYIEKYGEKGRLTDAVFQLGRAFEFQTKPNEMLRLYRTCIEKYISITDNAGVDALIEGYAEKYAQNKDMLKATVDFLDQLDNDPEFRKQIVSDRGFLFEYFYLNQQIDESLYNKFRNHPNFSPELASGMAPITDLTDIYKNQLNDYPKEDAEAYFRSLLSNSIAEGNITAEARSLMGLFRIKVEVAPSTPYTAAFFESATPRLLLYVADYSRTNDLDFAIRAWQEVLAKYATDDAAIVALLRLADVSDQKGEKKEAFNFLSAILDQFPGSVKIPGVILRQGELLSEMGESPAAREKYQYILRVPDWRGPIHAQALFQTGESYLAEGKFAEAHGFFERTYLGYSHFAEWAAKAYLSDAQTLLKMGQAQDATAVLKEAIEQIGDKASEELVAPIRSELQKIPS